MKSMLRWLVSNLGLMVLALLFGFGAWTLSTLQDNPIIENTLSARVVKLGENQLGNATWTGTLPTTVTLSVRAPRSTYDQLNGSGLAVYVDLSKLPVGTHVVPLTPTLPAGEVELLSVQPVTAVVTIQHLTQVRMPVSINIVGTPALGFRVGEPTSIPTLVTVTGTQDVISRVQSANAVVSVDGARASVESEVRVYARDSDGQVVDEAQVVPDFVSVRVPLEQLSNYRDLAVFVQLQGQPAEGYAVTDVSVDPVIVTIYGPVEAVQATKGYIETLPVVIDGAKNDIDEQVGLDLPSGVSLVSEKQTSVHVHIRVQPLMGSRTVKRSPVLIGYSAAFSATVSPATVDILLNGPLPQLNSLTDSDVIVEVDLAGLPAGVHQLTPIVRVPEGITAQSVLPATVQVELTPAITSTPASGTTPTPSGVP